MQGLTRFQDYIRDCRNGLEGWAKLLSHGHRLLDHVDLNAVFPWVGDPSLSQPRAGIDGLLSPEEREGNGPWLAMPPNIAAPVVMKDRFVIDFLELASEAQSSKALSYQILALVDLCDGYLRVLMNNRFSHNRRIFDEYLVENDLVALPRARWWTGPCDHHLDGRPMTYNPSFGDCLRAVVPVQKPSRIIAPYRLAAHDSVFDDDLQIGLFHCDINPNTWFEFSLRATHSEPKGSVGFRASLRDPPALRHLYREFGKGTWDNLGIAVFPELSMNEPVWISLSNLLNDRKKGPLIIAGSGHVIAKGPDRDSEIMVNTSPLIDRMYRLGEVPILSHWKILAYRLRRKMPEQEALIESMLTTCSDPDLVDAARHCDQLPEALDLSSGKEGKPLVFADSLFGRIGIMICRDIIGHSNLIQTVVDARLDHLFVPALHFGSLERFEPMLIELRRSGVATYLINGSGSGGSWAVTLPIEGLPKIIYPEKKIEGFHTQTYCGFRVTRINMKEIFARFVHR